VPGGLHHFECYEVHRSRLIVPSVTLSDDFGSGTATVRDPKRVCNPANKEDEDPSAPTDPAHLVAYNLKNISPRFSRLNNQVVANQFGTITVDIIRPQLLMVPSAKSLTSPPPPLGPTTLDHFQCYKTHGRTRLDNIKVEDEFGTIHVDIKRPSRLCEAVSKNGEVVPQPNAHLMCYDVRLNAGSSLIRVADVFVDNQFGPQTMRRYRTRELCVPSFLNPGTCGDGSVNAPGEQCDLSDDSACPGNCINASCTCPVCGNGVPEPGEQCDDGNLIDGDACESDCTLPSCGNGIVDGGETCDDGANNGLSGFCNATCDGTVP